ncbi:MAG TPA: flagellar hook capping FlgD N-terminal domain-containing protein [Tepidisphaeraceae bacterium]|nr:flagellar hook capping FlgD N-terminal domain-containing protein [Tepidisphaeraceae bacterium]
MTTSPLTTSLTQPATTALPAASTKAMTPSDFLNLMVTQLQNQDPTQPTSSADLLAQMSQIGQMQSATSMQTAMQGITLQNSIGAASSLIGKTVQGMDAQNNTISGMVNSVKVLNNGVSLELDNGQELDIARVTNIAPTPTKAAA